MKESDMGFTKINIEIGRLSKSNGKDVFQPVASTEVLVDTGATYTTISADILQRCDVTAQREVSLRLADGKIVKRPLGYAWLVVEGVRIHTPILFGEPEDPSLLGVIALEDANLTVDPVTRQLFKGTSYIQY